MLIDEDIKLDFNDVLLKPKRSKLSSRKDVDITRTFKNPDGSTWDAVPIIAANMDSVGSFEMADALSKHGCLTALHKHYSVYDLIEYFQNHNTDNVFYSMGTSDVDIEKMLFMKKELGKDFNKLCIDVANGYSEKFIRFVGDMVEKNPDTFIMAGNVVTAEVTEQLILLGVSCVKVGIGPGSACTTRKMTGVGYPQLSAIIECADAAHGLGGYVCGDGGCTVPGDIVKAFAGGADFVMLGGMLSGTDESKGDDVVIDGEKYKQYYGMSSKTAMNKHHGGVAEYRASEGKTVLVKCKGTVDDVMQDTLGGLRSGMTYFGAHKLKEIPKRATFMRVNRQLNNVFGDDIGSALGEGLNALLSN